MSLDTKLYTLLSGDSAVAALVSTRIYPVLAPQGAALPMVIFTRISSGREYTLSGATGLENPRVQIDCYSETYSEAKSVSEAVVAAIRGATTFRTAWDDPRESYEEDEIFRVSIDFSIWNEES